jgi:lysozyme family protein
LQARRALGGGKFVVDGKPGKHAGAKVIRMRFPAGNPAEPPFTWFESTKDALAYDGLDKVKDWSVELLCCELEKYNGFGYREHGDESR